jgi:hypothetical protein
MHEDESLAPSRPPVAGISHPDIRLPAPARAKGPPAPGGVPPMFASGAQVSSPGTRGDALEA